MGFRNVVNDGSAKPPRLRMQYNMWAASRLPRDGVEWTVAERLDRITQAGFTGFEAHVQTDVEADELAKMLRDRNLGIGFGAYPHQVDDLSRSIELAHRIGADYLTAQVFGSLKSCPQIVEMLREMFELVNDAGLPFFVETHRGRVTQDLRRTVKITRKFPKVRFTGDFSHYVTAGEFDANWPDELWKHLSEIAERCGNWHGRIAGPEQIQLDVGDGAGTMARQFKKLWTLGMTAWLKKSRPGDVLPFCCELGPPPYSITDLSGRELSDRWEQSLVIKRLAEEAWADALAAQQAAEVIQPAALPLDVTAVDTATNAVP